jgi:proteic killer suppression protein
LVPAFAAFRAQATKRLTIPEAAITLTHLQALPSNRLEAVRGDRAGQWSIRINLQWRICFDWPEGASDPGNVEIVDYH